MTRIYRKLLKLSSLGHKEMKISSHTHLNDSNDTPKITFDTLFLYFSLRQSIGILDLPKKNFVAGGPPTLFLFFLFCHLLPNF